MQSSGPPSSAAQPQAAPSPPRPSSPAPSPARSPEFGRMVRRSRDRVAPEPSACRSDGAAGPRTAARGTRRARRHLGRLPHPAGAGPGDRAVGTGGRGPGAGAAAARRRARGAVPAGRARHARPRSGALSPHAERAAAPGPAVPHAGRRLRRHLDATDGQRPLRRAHGRDLDLARDPRAMRSGATCTGSTAPCTPRRSKPTTRRGCRRPAADRLPLPGRPEPAQACPRSHAEDSPRFADLWEAEAPPPPADLAKQKVDRATPRSAESPWTATRSSWPATTCG